ncbi:hypothetical protein L9F63_006975, partial [Diploptera punctata]
GNLCETVAHACAENQVLSEEKHFKICITKGLPSPIMRSLPWPLAYLLAAGPTLASLQYRRPIVSLDNHWQKKKLTIVKTADDVSTLVAASRVKLNGRKNFKKRKKLGTQARRPLG